MRERDERERDERERCERERYEREMREIVLTQMRERDARATSYLYLREIEMRER